MKLTPNCSEALAREYCPIGSRWTHPNRPDATYTVTGHAMMQMDDRTWDLTPFVLYTSGDDRTWSRPFAEFKARFTRIPEADDDIRAALLDSSLHAAVIQVVLDRLAALRRYAETEAAENGRCKRIFYNPEAQEDQICRRQKHDGPCWPLP